MTFCPVSSQNSAATNSAAVFLGRLDVLGANPERQVDLGLVRRRQAGAPVPDTLRRTSSFSVGTAPTCRLGQVVLLAPGGDPAAILGGPSTP